MQNVNAAILGFGDDYCPIVQNGFAADLLDDAIVRDGLPMSWVDVPTGGNLRIAIARGHYNGSELRRWQKEPLHCFLWVCEGLVKKGFAAAAASE